jgi:hypothetical protein
MPMMKKNGMWEAGPAVGYSSRCRPPRVRGLAGGTAPAVGALQRRPDGAARPVSRWIARLARGRAPDQLLPRLAANEEILHWVFEQLTEAVTAGRRVTPASEWLLDNFYLIEEQIRTAKRHLPRNYSRSSRASRQGPSAGFPRVYDIALETIAHGDGRST